MLNLQGAFHPTITSDYLKMFAFVSQKSPKKEDHMVTKTCRSMRKKNYMRIKKNPRKIFALAMSYFLRNDDVLKLKILKFE